jgi:hypothetical protein
MIHWLEAAMLAEREAPVKVAQRVKCLSSTYPRACTGGSGGPASRRTRSWSKRSSRSSSAGPLNWRSGNGVWCQLISARLVRKGDEGERGGGE